MPSPQEPCPRLLACHSPTTEARWTALEEAVLVSPVLAEVAEPLAMAMATTVGALMRRFPQRS